MSKVTPRRIILNSAVSEPLREAIKAYDGSLYALAIESKVDGKTLGLFLKGLRSLNLVSADALCDVLGLRLVVVGRGRGRAKPRGNLSR